MRASSFAGSLVFAALAGLAVIPWILVFAPLVGTPWALGLYSLSLSGVYLAWIAPTWSRAMAVFVAAAMSSLGIAALSGGVLGSMPISGVLGASLIVAVGRGVFLFSGQRLRGLVVECLLIAGGLLFARAFGSSLLGWGLAFWGFFLVQSLFFLMGGISRPREEEPELDLFDSARQRAMMLMENLG